MVRKTKITSLWLLVALSSGCYASTGWKSWADGKINTNYTSATSIKTQVTSSLQGPQFRARWNSLGRIRPINVQSPKLSVGCNGIDIGFGSLSFLNFDELVEKLKGLAASAPAFAFKMAIDTVCSQCSTIMNDLEGIVNEINSMSLDSCSVAQGLGNAAGEQITSALNLTAESGTYTDGYKADKALKNDQPTFLKNGWDSFKAGIASLNDDAKALVTQEKFLYGSVLNNARLDLEASAGLDGVYFVNMARGLVGDVLVCTNTENQNYVHTPMATISTQEFIEALVFGKEGKTIKALKIEMFDETGVDLVNQKIISSPPTTCNVKSDDLTIDENATFTKLVKDKILSTLNKLKTPRTPLSDQDKNFIATLPTNGYIIMNLLKMEKGNIDIDYFSEYIALENAKVQLTFILSETSKMIGEYMKQTKVQNENLKKDLVKLKETTDKKLVEAEKTFTENLKDYRSVFGAIAKYKYEILKDVTKAH